MILKDLVQEQGIPQRYLAGKQNSSEGREHENLRTLEVPVGSVAAQSGCFLLPSPSSRFLFPLRHLDTPTCFLFFWMACTLASNTGTPLRVKQNKPEMASGPDCFQSSTQHEIFQNQTGAKG